MNATRQIDLPTEPEAAAAALREASLETDVVVFKKSPICPVSTRAEAEFRAWLGGLTDQDATRVAVIDVIAEKPLARGLTAALGIQHESPQALWFRGGELAWHDSHGSLTRDRFARG
ncbi:MAG: monothiol bacilliredoxin BrxC family protein [Planctomycetota bacterium]